MSIKLTEEMKKAVERCVWFEPPEQAVKDIPRLAAYILTYGTPEDTFALREQINDAELKKCLDKAPPGIYDKRSWAYWNLVVGRYDTPPMPERKFPE
jgi:hypothetical protein